MKPLFVVEESLLVVAIFEYIDDCSEEFPKEKNNTTYPRIMTAKIANIIGFVAKPFK
jgi:hypothetical protein